MSTYSSLVILLLSVYIAWKQLKPQSRVKVKLAEEYDYIVVGAGSAGSVVASRLSEDPGVTVALLEAGGEETGIMEAEIPLAWYDLQNTEVDWAYRTKPQQKACLGMNNQQCAWPRGKIIGGSSILNAMWYVRGSRHDYDRWADKFGADGWSYSEVLPYFIKSEGHTDEQLVKSGYHGKDGPWKVKVQDNFPELIELYLNASKELGHDIYRDINGKNQEGFSPMSSFIDNGKRSSSASAFLRPAMERENLDVLTKAHVTRILFEGKKAVGVEYVKDGNIQRVRTAREIILSAGAIGSPQILMLSGVGHKEHLNKFGIEVVADLPVGDNLQDHIFTLQHLYEVDQPISISTELAQSKSELLQYLFMGTGMLTSNVVEATGFYRTGVQSKDDSRPYIQSALVCTLPGNDPSNLEKDVKNFNTKGQIADDLAANQENKYGFGFFLGLQRPGSSGTIRLQSGNPFHHPIIDPNYFSDQQDLEHLLWAIRHTQQYIKTETFKKFGVKAIPKVVHTECEGFEFDSDDFWRCRIRQTATTAYHPSCTCKMGRKEDKTTVVDSQLRVHGIEGLRVADASIMPEVTTGNTNAPTVMIGEKAADLIKGQILPPIKNL